MTAPIVPAPLPRVPDHASARYVAAVYLAEGLTPQGLREACGRVAAAMDELIAEGHAPAVGATALVGHTVTFDLAAPGDQGGTYYVLSEALRDWADRQREQAQAEGGNDQRDTWAARAEQLLGAVEAAIDGSDQ